MSETDIARVVLVLDACGESTLPPEVLGLARELGGSLAGLFVEDERLQRAAELPLTCEIGLWSGREQPLEADGLARRLAELATRREHLLAEAARRNRLNWSCARVSGSRAVAMLAARDTADLFYFASRSRQATQAPARPAVYAVFTGSPAARRGLAAAWRLASRQGLALVLLTLGELEREAELALDSLAARARVEQLDGDAEHLLAVLSGLRGSALVLPEDAIPASDAGFVDALLVQLRCPLLLAC